jgi:hypothetical protein
MNSLIITVTCVAETLTLVLINYYELTYYYGYLCHRDISISVN